MDELAICAIFRNEAPYLHEWLSYHYAQGVRRFVLYDNASTDASRAAIGGWARRELVTVIDWPGQGMQVHAYADLAARFRDVAEWCAFIDCDEFLVPQSSLSLLDVVRLVGREADGLYVHWWMFGSSGHIARPPGLVTETYRWRAPDGFGSHAYGKSIMRLSALTHAGLHVFRCRGRMINDAGWEVDQHSAGGQARHSHRLLALNHYFTKSREEWRQRRALGKADKTASDPEFRRAESEFAQHDINAVRDDRAALFMQAARALFYLPPAAPDDQPGPRLPCCLLTAHGTLLCWDETAGRAAHREPERLTRLCRPLLCDRADGAEAACRLVREGGGAAVAIDGATVFRLVAGGGASWHLQAGSMFLCAEAGSDALHANRAEAREWETFVPVSPAELEHLVRLPPPAAQLLPGFQLQLGEDLYDLRWGAPAARLAATAPAPAPPRTSLTLYDLEHDPFDHALPEQEQGSFISQMASRSDSI